MTYIPSNITMTFHETAPVVTRADQTLWLAIEAGQVKATIFLSVEQAQQLASDLIDRAGEEPEPTGTLEPTEIDVAADKAVA